MGELKRIASNSVVLVGARVIGMLAGLGTVLLLSRALGLADLGAMMLCMSVSAILSAIASCNIESVAIRSVVRYREDGDTRKLAGFHAFGLLTIGGFALITLLIAAIDALSVGYGVFDVFWRYGVFAAPLFALVRLNAETVSASGDVLAAILPKTLLRPVFLYLGLAIVTVVNQGLTLELALRVFYGALASVLLVQFLYVLPSRLKEAAPSLRAWRTADLSEWRGWSTGGMRLMLPYLFIEYSTDLIVVSATLVLEKPEIAVLGVLLRIVSLHRFITVAVGQAAAPRISAAWVRGERRRLHGILAAIGLATLGVQVSAVLFHLLFGDFELSIFAPAFAGHRYELALFAMMAVTVAFFGQTTRMAAITDLRGYLATLYVSSLAALVIAVAGFGLLFGLTGVGVATMLVWIGWNAALWRKIRSEHDVDCSAIGAYCAWRSLRSRSGAAAPSATPASTAAE